MFTQVQITLLLNALDLAQKSNSRAMNNSKSPAFKELYLALDREMNDVSVILRGLAPTKTK